MEVVDQSTLLISWPQCVIDNRMVQFSSIVSKCSFKIYQMVGFLHFGKPFIRIFQIAKSIWRHLDLKTSTPDE